MDFGPLNLGKLYKFCRLLYGKLKLDAFQKKKIVYWTVLTSNKRTNAAFLIGGFAVILLAMKPRDVMAILPTSYKYPPFNDANMGGTTGIYTLRLIDCFNGINKAFYFNMVDFSDFDLTEYETYEGANPQGGGDLSWIVPEKLLAFAGPCGERNGNWPVEVYLKYFKERNVYTVIRLNKSRYDSNRFTSHGIDHYDLIFPDGSTPPDDILNDFLEIVENTEGATAVHCKAGLGRTGCLIGIYLMKQYRMTASEAIAWMRICRPGCVIGQQQTWLETKQPWAWRQGNIYRDRMNGDSEKTRQHKFAIYSIKGKSNVRVRNSTEEERKAKFAQVRDRINRRMNSQDDNEDLLRRTQGDFLVAARDAHVRKEKNAKEVIHQSTWNQPEPPSFISPYEILERCDPNPEMQSGNASNVRSGLDGKY
uniref:protein-tyrosine-phosphatase n=1 Tax=Lygus hesperus TaxID=30085 RepID=A0A0A9XW90_LYGHE